VSVAVLCLTPSAKLMAAHLARGLGADLHAHRGAMPLEGSTEFVRLGDRLAELWGSRDGLVVVAPSGVVVRGIAPLLEGKLVDPGVVAVDALGRWAVPLCGGHERGANELSRRVANLLGAEAVVTTATEAVRDLVVGIGCRRGAPMAAIREAVDAALASRRMDPGRVRLFATASPKRDEPGLLELSRTTGIPLAVVHDIELRARVRVRRTAAWRRFRFPSVSQSSALAAGRRTRCILSNFRRNSVVVSIARECSGWWDSGPEAPSTAPPRP
jgi:cobalt-precorrin 5A hydrolase